MTIVNPSPSSDEPPGEAFIPFLRKDLVDLCLKDGRLAPEQQTRFREFAEILTAFTHFQFHAEMEALKENYACFDPDRATQDCAALSAEELHDRASRVVAIFKDLATKANCHPVSTEQLQESFKDSTLIDLQTDVDLDDFREIVCFARGNRMKKERVTRWFRKVEIDAPVWERVLLLLHFQDEEQFRTPKQRRKNLRPQLPFEPGKIYAYLYKDIPKADLELIFPNVKISMTPKDKLLLSVPAVGAGAMAIAKVSSKMLLLAGAIAFLIWGAAGLKWLGLSEDQVSSFFPTLTALLMVLATLGTLGFKQWDKYKNKRNNFLKAVSENLFFRNLATNQAVFHRMLDNAEEEECKEALLVYYHILTRRDQPMTAAELDHTIETWMAETFGVVIDFDIDGPLANLQRIAGPDRTGRHMPLLTVDADGRLHTPALDDAKHIIDHLWDAAFQYNGQGNVAQAEPRPAPSAAMHATA